VHIVTVNDYLARRDAEWMSPIYRVLGMTVGVIVHDLDDKQRRAAYGADITYGTNNEFGFDYLRDNMKFDLADCVQRGHHFCIVDEVDSILIDEARTPLIISGPAEESTDKYYRVDKIVPKLIQDVDYSIDEKQRTATLTEEGVSKCERLLGLGNLYDPAHMEVIHHVYQALRAHTLYKLDTDYVVKDGEVVIVDEFTGRQMPGRRWSDGLHQAIEAKEGVKIERENQTLATITFQNYFRMYKKLSGMTGTAETEATEFGKIYGLDVVVIPTNRTLIRLENPDIVYRTERKNMKLWSPASFRKITAWVTASSKSRHGPARAGRDDFHREIRALGESAEEIGCSAPGIERQAARARSQSDCAGRTQGRGHRGNEHGGPRNRYFARRQSRIHGAGILPEKSSGNSLCAGRFCDWSSRGWRRRRRKHGHERNGRGEERRGNDGRSHRRAEIIADPNGDLPDRRQDFSGAHRSVEADLRSNLPSNAAPSTMK